MEIQKTVTKHLGKMAFQGQANGHEFILDDGEGNTGPRPKIILLNALAACSGMDVVSILNKMRISFSDFSIDVDGTLGDDHPKIYIKIHKIYKIRVSPEHHQQVEKAIKLSEEKYCGVEAMLSKASEITSEIIYL